MNRYIGIAHYCLAVFGPLGNTMEIGIFEN